MITIPDILEPNRVLLGLSPATPEAAAAAVIDALATHPQVLDWSAFKEALQLNPPCHIAATDALFAVCLPHARTPAVEGIVMSAGRLAKDTFLPQCPKPIRYIFCIGAAREMAADYLRIAGALMRVLGDASEESLLHAAETPEDFVECLGELEKRL